MYDEFIARLQEMIANNALANCEFPKFVYCHKTQPSTETKPIQGNIYIVRKMVTTKWGDKLQLIGLDCQEVWGDKEYLSYIPPMVEEQIPIEIQESLRKNLHEAILADCTPAIGEVLKKDYAGLGIMLTNGIETFVSKRIIYPESIYLDARVGEIIELHLPLWFAKNNKIIQDKNE